MPDFNVWETDDKDGTEAVVSAGSAQAAAKQYGVLILNEEIDDLDDDIAVTVELDGHESNYTVRVYRQSGVETWQL